MPYKDPEDQKRSARRHYEANSWTYKNRAAANRRRQRAAIKQIIRTAKDRPCTDCGEQYPYYVMQFDHRLPSDKLFTIGETSRKSIAAERIIAEIGKCDVVCANCHAERTHQRRQYYSTQSTDPMDETQNTLF